MVVTGKHIHFMGAGGSGCSAVMALAKHFGYRVSGCDLEKDSPYLEKSLASLVKLGHDKSHIKEVDILVYSPAIPLLAEGNLERKEAESKGVRSMPWEEFLANEILPGKFLIAVTGTHGKGTTSAMLSVILEKAGLDPTCLVGAKVREWNTNYRVGQSKYFVLEADEYRDRFLVYKPDVAIITNIDFDHPDYFKDLNSLRSSFAKFAANLNPGSVLVVGPGVDLENKNGKTKKVSEAENYNLKVIGEFNRVNASLAAATAKQLKINQDIINDALEGFTGLARRFEFKGEAKGVTVFDDYAVHPVEVVETLRAAREKFPERTIWAVFQPHTFSRLKAFLGDFALAFERSPVDKIVIVDVFGAREKGDNSVRSLDLAKAIKEKNARYIPGLEEAAVYIAKESSSGDVVVNMGAGDNYKIADMLVRKLANKL